MKTYSCEKCREIISQEEYEVNNGLCEFCNDEKEMMKIQEGIAFKTLGIHLNTEEKEEKKSPVKIPQVVPQEKCNHPKKFNTSYPTHSGCYLIHETICNVCGKVLEHSSEEVNDLFMQKVFQH